MVISLSPLNGTADLVGCNKRSALHRMFIPYIRRNARWLLRPTRTDNDMRLFFAFIYMGVGMWIFFRLGGDSLPPYIGLGVGFALMFSSVYVCNEGFLRRLKGQSDNEYIDELLANKMAVREKYSSSRAITFDDLSTGCLCHILDIGKDKSLCLYGQYLYEYSQIDDDPEINQDRKFPTSEFSLIRNVKKNEVMRLEIGEDVIDEIRYEKVDVKKFYDLGIKLDDGEIINTVPFSNILNACN